MNVLSRTRFAPAPTGWLHLGHVVNAVYVWGLAARLGARVVLRVEDHDAERSRPLYETALLDDLDWLGFTPDVHPAREFRAGACASRQSDRSAIYEAAAGRLIADGLVYGCTCTRQDLARREPGAADGTPRYPGTCRTTGVPPGDDVAWRVRLDPGIETFDDLLHGPQRSVPAGERGDLVIRDRRGNWTYQFAVVVDDLDQQIDLVIRGDDLRGATADQIRLARMIGRTIPPRFAHHAVLMKSPTQKLSKADGDTGIRELRRSGWTPARVVGAAAFAVGLVPAATDISAAEVPALFGGVQFASAVSRKASPVQK